MHGKLGALYALRPNGYEGIAASLGLNDVTWGVGCTAAASTIYKAWIDASVPSPDTFTWTVNGGGGVAAVAITGAAQALGADAQTITFAAVDGHTINDSWTIGNLKVEPTTINGSTAQITTVTNRFLNPNAPPTWTPTNAVQLLSVNYTNGMATFSGAPGVTTVTGNNGMVMAASLQKVGYLLDWSLNLTLEMADSSAMGDAWKTALPGLAGGSGSANAYFIATHTLLNCLQNTIAAGNKYFLLQLFNYDPDADQTGDHINAWVTFTSFAIGPTINAVVKETVNFQVQGDISFTANV